MYTHKKVLIHHNFHRLINKNFSFSGIFAGCTIFIFQGRIFSYFLSKLLQCSFIFIPFLFLLVEFNQLLADAAEKKILIQHFSMCIDVHFSAACCVFQSIFFFTNCLVHVLHIPTSMCVLRHVRRGSVKSSNFTINFSFSLIPFP